MDALVIVLSVLLTGMFYSAIPIIVSALRKNPICKKKHMLFVVIVSVSIYCVFGLIYMLQSEDTFPKVTALIIWGNVSYYLGLAILKKRHMLLDADIRSGEIAPNNMENYEMRFCHKCGNKLEFDSRFCSKCGTRIGG